MKTGTMDIDLKVLVQYGRLDPSEVADVRISLPVTSVENGVVINTTGIPENLADVLERVAQELRKK